MVDSVIFYHGTKPSLIPKILKEGLNPKYMGTGYEGAPEKRKAPAISLSSTPHHAQAYMRLGASEDAKTLKDKLKALLGIGVPKPLKITLPKSDLPELAWGVGKDKAFDEHHYYKKISPAQIEKISNFHYGFFDELEKIALGWDHARIDKGNLHVTQSDTSYHPTSLTKSIPKGVGKAEKSQEPFSRGRTAYSTQVSVPLAQAKSIPSLQPYLKRSIKKLPLHKKLYYKLKTSQINCGGKD